MCRCRHEIMGLSAQAIAGYGKHHPHDPSDLNRCIEYWTGSTAELQKRMAGRSPEWDRLLPHWDELVALLRQEMAERTDLRAPRTYFEMRRIIDGGVACTDCDATGRKEACCKCKGTGRRSGGRCRPCYGSGTAEYCPTCRGRGYSKKEGSDGSHRVDSAKVRSGQR